MYGMNEQLKDYRTAMTICIARRNITFAKGFFIHVPQDLECNGGIKSNSV
jgi:hypothetical protein